MATKSQSIMAMVLMSSLSLSVNAAADNPPPNKLMPLLFDKSPPTTTTQSIRP